MEISVLLCVCLALACLTRYRPQIFILVLIIIMQFESVFLYYSDFVIAGCRVFPLDVLSMLLYLVLPILIISNRKSIHGPFKLLFLLGAILVIPVVQGYLQGAGARGIIRDTRPIIQLFLFIPLAAMMKDGGDWSRIRKAIKIIALSGAYIMFAGMVLDWRILNVDAQWQVSETLSGSAARGYGIISTYMYFPIALYLELVDWSKRPSGSGNSLTGLLNIVVLAGAMLCTFIRASVLMLVVMLAARTIVIMMSGKPGVRPALVKIWTVVACIIGGVGILAMASPYFRVTGERFASIFDPELGGDSGMGTFQVRIKSFETAQSSLNGYVPLWLGHGYGSIDTRDVNLVRYLNHNSYAWLLYNGGYATLALCLFAIGLLIVKVYRSGKHCLDATADVIAMIVGALSLGGSTGYVFGGYQPSGMVMIALFLAAWSALAAKGAAAAKPSELPRMRAIQRRMTAMKFHGRRPGRSLEAVPVSLEAVPASRNERKILIEADVFPCES